MIPAKLQVGDEIRVIAPSKSLAVVSNNNINHALQFLESLGLKVSFGRHVNENDMMMSSSVESRLADLHEAFANQNIKAILTVLGGYNSNQLLDDIN